MLTPYESTEQLTSNSRYAQADLFAERRQIEGFRTVVLSRAAMLPLVSSLSNLLAELGITSINSDVAGDGRDFASKTTRPQGANEPLAGEPIVPGLLVVDQPWTTTRVVHQVARQLGVQLAGVEQTMVLTHRHNLMTYSDLVVAGSGYFFGGGTTNETGLANLWHDVGHDAFGKPVRTRGLGLLPVPQEWRRNTVFPFVS